MKIYYQHLLNFLKDKPSIEEISKKLFQLGHENEVNHNEIDIEITPNRGDCLSLIGIARDLGVFYDIDSSVEIYEGKLKDLKINFINDDQMACPKISFIKLKVSNIKKTYMEYLSDYFNQSGLNNNNLFADISNYISYELGQPLHCYDYTKIGSDITFKKNTEKTSFKTLLNQDLELDENDYIFSSNHNIINLAGIIGGKNTACDLDTKTVLVEAAKFNPTIIAGRSIKHNLNSDAAYKFEREVNFRDQEKALRRFIKIVDDHANIEDVSFFTTGDFNFQKSSRIINTNFNEINDILGTKLEFYEFKNSLEKLNFSVKNNKIIAPYFRHDIESKNDIAEEIARVIGYDNISVKKFSIKKSTNEDNTKNKANYIRQNMIAHGFYETINFPFTSNKYDGSYILDNPLDSNKKYLRTSLKNSLIENLLYNERRNKESIKFFEISNIYNKGKNISEIYVGVIASGRVANNYINYSNHIDLQYLHECIGSILSDNSIEISEIDRANLNSKSKSKIFYAEFKLNLVSEDIVQKFQANQERYKFNSYKSISEYPVVKRDLSFSSVNLNHIKELDNIIHSLDSMYLKEVFSFDLFLNKKINQYKVAYRFIFQSNDKTLKEDEINKAMQDIINSCLKVEGVSIPGLN